MCTTGQLCTAPYSFTCSQHPEASELLLLHAKWAISLTMLSWQGLMAVRLQ